MKVFETSLHKYGKAIIRSAIPHTNELIYSLEMSVRRTKNNVIAHYDHSQKEIADLEKKLLEACTFVETLKQSIE